MLIISVDPGNGTGVDFYWRHRDQVTSHFSYEIFGLLEVVDQLRLWNLAVKGSGVPVFCAVEEYTMTSGKGPKTAQPLALKIMGAVEVVAADFGWRHQYFQPKDCKKRCTNDTLRKLGWWQPTKDGHINDARRVTLSSIAVNFPDEFARMMGI